MAKTSTERMQAKREREAQERREAEDSTYPYLRETFAAYLEHESEYSEVELILGIAGIEAPLINDERGPENFILEGLFVDPFNPFPGSKGSIGRAEVTVTCLLDAASYLASIINTYKLREIDARLAELKNPDNADRETAIEEAVKLNKIKDQLEKQVRWSFPQWKVTGV